MIETNCQPHQQPPTRFSPWDVAAVGAYTLGTVFNVIDDGLRLLSRVFFAAAEDHRERMAERDYEREQEAARREMAASLEQTIYGPGDLT